MSVYAISDLHGRKDLYDKVCKFLKPEDKVICLGDCGDRGPNSWELIKAVYENPQWEYIKGNHEDLLTEGMRLYLGMPEHTGYINLMHALEQNGTLATLSSWVDEGADKVWLDKLTNLPAAHTYGNARGLTLLLSHSGYWGLDEYDLIWNREHILCARPEYAKDTMIIHGHTPIQLLVKELNKQAEKLHLDECWSLDEPGVVWYCDNYKIDIDCGSVWSDYTTLLNLDTFEEHIFVVKRP